MITYLYTYTYIIYEILSRYVSTVRQDENNNHYSDKGSNAFKINISDVLFFVFAYVHMYWMYLYAYTCINVCIHALMFLHVHTCIKCIYMCVNVHMNKMSLK